MFYIGIDVGKFNHCACVVSSEGEVLIEPFFAIKLDSPIFSIPGIGIYSGMSILSEIGDIHNFSSAVKVMGFAGVDPGTYQSG